MKLHVDLETFQLIEGPGFRNPISSLRFKRGDAARLEVSFLRNGTTPEAIGDPAALELRFGIKPRNRYDVGYLVHTADWTLPAIDAETPVYQCAPSFNTTELNAALNVGSTTSTELSEITLMGEITWREGAGEPTSTRTFAVIVENDVNRGDEGVPTDAEPAYPAPDNLEITTRKGVANGYASLDGTGKVPAAQLAITATSIGDSTPTGRSLITAPSAAAARTTLGAMATPSLGAGPIHGLNQAGTWVNITQGRRSVLTAPSDYAFYPLPIHFKGLALYTLDSNYGWMGYTLADLVSYMESYHGGTFWTDILTQGTGEWTVPAISVLNLNDGAAVPLGAYSSWPELTSQPGRMNPGAEIYLDPLGMATLRFLSPGLVSVHGDLTAVGSPYGSY